MDHRALVMGNGLKREEEKKSMFQYDKGPFDIKVRNAK